MLQLLTYGLQNGALRHISEVSNGLSCNCICPHCKQALVAKNNSQNKKEAHFAHYTTVECDGAIETALHLLAKDVLQKTKSLFLPDYHYDYNPDNEWSKYNEGREIYFDEIFLETSIEIEGKQIIPDAIGVFKNKQILIEFANTHFVDEYKTEKIKNTNLPCVEVDLKGQILDEQSISDFLNNQTSMIYWIVNPRFDSKYKQEKERINQERKIQQLKSEKMRIESPQKLSKYKLDKHIRILAVNKDNFVCPANLIKLKQSKYYSNPLLKRIIDGEFWNGVIYKNFLMQSIYLKNENIELSSSEDWKGLKRMQYKINNWDCEGGEDDDCNYCGNDKFYFKQCCFKCIFFVEKLEVDYKRYIICKFS